MKKTIKILFVLTLFINIFFIPRMVFANDVVGGVEVAQNGDAPNTTAIIENALANGATPREAANAGVDYLQKNGYPDAYQYTNTDGSIYVSCTNGSGVTITPPPVVLPTVVPPIDVPPTAVPPTGVQTCEQLGNCVVPPPEAPLVIPPPYIPPVGPPVVVPQGPVCGADCTNDTTKCQNIVNCSQCLPNPNGQGKICQAQPAATATPTPNPFNTAMCKCDNITLEPASFVAGQKVNVVAYSKVEGGDLSYATIPNMIFNSERYTDPAHGIRDIPLDVSIGTIIVEQSATKIRYKAVWNYTIPANPVPNVVYKVRSVPQCVQKTAGIQSSSRVADTAAPVTVSASKNIFNQIIDFILNIFGKKSTSKIQSADTIQLDVLKMGVITGTDHCTYIEFQVK